MTEKKNPTYVTRPYLPPLGEFIPYLEKIWDSRVLTNGGPFHQELEEKLCEYLGVKHISLFNNGTIALVTALQALKISGEVITTPYSFVATAHSLLWNGIRPVFVDISPKSLNLDPNKIEAAITDKTTAILPVHCYGNPCDVEAIEKIAQKHGLKVIYDAAHAFGVNDQNGSILNHGDLSILSFHATKVFNTFEGGAIVCKDLEMKKHIDNLKNFGFVDEVTVVEYGINGKMSELNAAIGLLQLEHIPQIISTRKAVADKYNDALKKIQGIEIQEVNLSVHSNFSYYPISITQKYHRSRDETYEHLKENGIFSRRYFYPLISDFSMYQQFESSSKNNTSVAHQVASEILCLPIYPDLDETIQYKIIQLLKN